MREVDGSAPSRAAGCGPVHSPKCAVGPDLRTDLAARLAVTRALFESVFPLQWIGHEALMTQLVHILDAPDGVRLLMPNFLTSRIELVGANIRGVVERPQGPALRTIALRAFPANQVETFERRYGDLARRHEMIASDLRPLLIDPLLSEPLEDFIEGMSALHERAAWTLRRTVSSLRARSQSSGSGRLRAAPSP